MRPVIGFMSVWCKGYDIKSDAMDWMLTNQLSSKNLSPGEKLAMMDEFKEEVRLENEKRKNNGSKLGGNVKNGNVPSLQLEGDHKKRNNYTDNQVAKKAELHQIWWKSRIIAQIMKQIQNLQN